MAKKILNLEEAAEHLGISTDDLVISRARGLAPGKLGFKKDGVLVWNSKDLGKSAERGVEPVEVEESEEVEEADEA